MQLVVYTKMMVSFTCIQRCKGRRNGPEPRLIAGGELTGGSCASAFLGRQKPPCKPRLLDEGEITKIVRLLDRILHIRVPLDTHCQQHSPSIAHTELANHSYRSVPAVVPARTKHCRSATVKLQPIGLFLPGQIQHLEKNVCYCT